MAFSRPQKPSETVSEIINFKIFLREQFFDLLLHSYKYTYIKRKYY